VSPAPGPDDLPASVHDGSFVIRRAEQADLLDVFRLERSTFPQPWPFSAFESFLGEPGFLVLTRAADPTVVGYVVSDTTPNYGRDIGHVKDLAVHPDARRQGLGCDLLHTALTVLAVEGAALVKLEVRASNDAALSLYRSEGFEPLRRVPRYYDDGEDAYVMVLELAEWVRPGEGRDAGVETETGASVGAEPERRDLVTDDDGR
jgi:ribosomal-protein-alanine N-acetyltransferase